MPVHRRDDDVVREKRRFDRGFDMEASV